MVQLLLHKIAPTEPLLIHLNKMIFKKQQHRGFTLLELLLVLSIASIIVLAGVGQYRGYKQKKDLAAIRENVALIQQGLNTYYHQYCRSDQAFNVKRADLQKANLWPHLTDTDIVSNTITNYDVQASLLGFTKLSNKPIYMLSVLVTLNIPKSMLSWYQKALGASTATTTTFTWRRMPSTSISNINDGLWPSRGGLGTFKEATSLETSKTCAN